MLGQVLVTKQTGPDGRLVSKLLVAAAEEPGEQNLVRRNTVAVEKQLIAAGVAPEAAAIQSRTSKWRPTSDCGGPIKLDTY